MADLCLIGDSVTAPSRAGQWVAGQGWGAILAATGGMAGINLAIPGMTTAQMQPQWDAALARDPSPSLIIAMPGENDIPGATAGTPVAAFAATLDAQIGAAVLKGLQLALATPFHYENATYLAAAPAYVQAIHAVAAKYRVPCVDVFGAFAALYRCDPVTYAAEVNPDGHPTIAGHQRIAALYALPQNAAVPLCRCSGQSQAPAGWSATDTNGFAISADGLTATCNAADKGVRSTLGKSSGKWFAKLRKNSGGNNVVIGIANASAGLDFPGTDANGWGLWTYNGNTIHGGVHAACGPAFADGSMVFVYLDADAGKLWFGNSSGWFGDPEAGTGAAFSGVAGPLFLMAGTTNPSPTTSVTIDGSDDPMRGSASLWQ